MHALFEPLALEGRREVALTAIDSADAILFNEAPEVEGLHPRTNLGAMGRSPLSRDRSGHTRVGMCNLYSLTKGQAVIRDWFRAKYDRTGNLPLFPSIFPDQFAPIVRNGADGERELVMARWGMPAPPQFDGQPVTNIRNLNSPHWRGWLGKNRRCIVPATSFCEYADTKPRKTPTWFALSEDRPLFAFAGLWTPWRGVRGPKSAPVQGMHELFGFLTTEANAIVAPVHPKAKDAEIARRYAACKDIAENHALLDGLEAFVHRLGVIGEEASIRGTYIAGTSRLSRDTAISYLRRGASAAGKNHSIIKILKLFPNEDVIVISSATAQALIYEGADANDRDALKHKD